MTPDQETGSATLPRPTIDRAPAAPQPLAPAGRPLRFFWVAVGLAVALVAGLAVWALTQSQTVDDLVEPPRVFSDHDAHIIRLLSGQESATQAAGAQLDPWIRRLLPEQDGPGGPTASHHDSGINAVVKDRAADANTCVPAAPGAGGWEGRLGHAC